MNARIIEKGNGFPDVGDYVSTADQLYMVSSALGPIQTSGSSGDWCECTVDEVDWDECDEADEFSCGVESV